MECPPGTGRLSKTAAVALHCHRCFLQVLPSVWAQWMLNPSQLKTECCLCQGQFNQIIAESQHLWDYSAMSSALPQRIGLERCSLTYINLYFYLRQVKKLYIGELLIFQLYVLGLAICSLSWELGIWFDLVTLQPHFFTASDTWLRILCYCFRFRRIWSVCAC